MPYVTGGLAWGRTHVNLNDFGFVVPPRRDITHLGWTAELGVEVAVGGTGPPRPSTTTSTWPEDLRSDRCRPAARQCRSRHSLVQARTELPAVGNPPGMGRRQITRRSALAEADGLEHSRTDHRHRARLPACARPIRARTACRATARSANLDRGARSRQRELWEGGEVYINPELAQGAASDRHTGPRRLLQRRSAEGRRALSEIARATIFLAPDIRARRRAGRGRRRAEPDRRQARRRPRHGDGRPVRRRRLFRRQRLRPRSARGLPELGDVGIGSLRFSGRPARLHPRRGSRTQPQGLGACAPEYFRCRLRPTATRCGSTRAAA